MRNRVVAVLATLVVACTALLAAGAPAQAFPDGCRELSPWTAYHASWSTQIMMTNRFLVDGCGIYTVADIDLIYIRDAHNAAQCAYFRVELFYADGRSAGAYTDNGPWTWKLLCDATYPQILLDDVVAGTKYDVQMMPMPDDPVQPLWLGNMLD